MAYDPVALFSRAQLAMGLTQEQLGAKLRVSRRTAQRYAASGAPSDALKPLAALVYPHDRDLAAAIAAAAGTTLEELGIFPPPPPPPAKPAPIAAPPEPRAPPPPPPPPLPPDGVVDAVVCAAAEAMDATPHQVRPGLLAAVQRARAIGVSLEQIERVLREALAPPAPPEPRRQRKAAGGG
jgi:hypothetical protein